MSDAHVPSQVGSLAKAERLGELRSVHDPRAATGRSRTWLVVLSLPGLVLLPFTVRFLLNGFGWATALSLVLTAGYLGAAGRILVRDVLPGYGRVLYLYEHGLIMTARNATTGYPWDAIKELRVSGARMASSDAVSWRFGVVREDGAEAEAGAEFPGVQGLVEVVSAEVTERMLPKYIARVEGGGKVRIGPFTITRECIAKGGEEVPWRYIAGVEISNGMIYVNRADRLSGMTATAGEVPNAVAFSELARYLRESGGAPGTGGAPSPSETS
ncbi:MAG: hypothetical protein JWR24_708 [Actinoallomurus sp.]|nr:hypothetical protein [Actinoallomurus sp.]